MVKRTCFAPNCRSQKKGGTGETVNTFTCRGSDDVFKQWQQKIPRKDKVFTRKHCLCQEHFLPGDIIRHNEFLINGEVVTIPRTMPLLKKDAVPCIWPNCPPDLTKVPKPRKPPAPRIQTTIDPVQYADAREESSDLNATEAITSDPLFLTEYKEEPIDIDDEENATTGFLPIHDFGSTSLCLGDYECQSKEMDLPPGWQELLEPRLESGKRCYALIEDIAVFPFYTLPRGCAVNSNTKTIDYYLGTKLCNELVGQLTWKCVHDLSELILNFSLMITCPGFEHEKRFDPLSRTTTVAELVDGIWHSKKCQILGSSQNNCCLECTNAKTLFLVRLRRPKSSAEEGTLPAIRLEMMTANELRANLQIAQQENKSLRSQVMRLTRSSKVNQQETSKKRSKARVNSVSTVKGS